MTDSSSTTTTAPIISANSVWGDDQEAQAVEAQIATLDTAQLQSRIRMLDNNIRVMKSESTRLGKKSILNNNYNRSFI